MTNKNDVKIKLCINGEKAIVRMYDNPTSQDFLELLPLTVTMEEYAGTEKIAYLPRKLSTHAAPPGSDPVTGDFAYYVPWGNIAVFYRDFRYSGELIILGTAESGLEKLTRAEGNFTATIEIME